MMDWTQHLEPEDRNLLDVYRGNLKPEEEAYFAREHARTLESGDVKEALEEAVEPVERAYVLFNAELNSYPYRLEL